MEPLYWLALLSILSLRLLYSTLNHTLILTGEIHKCRLDGGHKMSHKKLDGLFKHGLTRNMYLLVNMSPQLSVPGPVPWS